MVLPGSYREDARCPRYSLARSVSPTTSAPGSKRKGETAMHMHPETYLWLVEQDRERAMTKRALQRAAREGGEQRPGLARGGITAFVRVLRTVASATINLRSAGPSGTSQVTGLSGA